MNEVSDRGVCFPVDINMKGDQTKDGDCVENNDPSSSEISMQSMVELYVASVKEGAELLSCDVNISLMQKKDNIGGASEINEDPKSIDTNRQKKRLKTTQPSDIPTNDLEITDEDTCLDLPIEIESTKVESFCHQSTSENLTAEDRISVENVSTSKLLEQDSDCVLGFHGTLSNNDNTEKTKENVVETFDADKLSTMQLKCSAGCAIVRETTKNDKISMPVSGDAHFNYVSPPLNEMEPGFSESSGSKITNKNSCDAHNSKNLLEEVHYGARIVRNFYLGKAVLENENISSFPSISSGEASGGSTSLHPEEQSVKYDNVSLKQLDDLGAVGSLITHKCITVAVEKAVSSCTEKKLLVLDVNGLLVDISPYVPYDYDPDDIILRKAGEEKNYNVKYANNFFPAIFLTSFLISDQFLRGPTVTIFSNSALRGLIRNMEPILDFLLGNDKSRLLFFWDQSHCTDTGFTTVEKRNRPLLLKKLKKLWDKCEPDLPWERGVYNESNTLLLDDTPSKSLTNPRYNAVFPHTYRFRNVRDNSLGPGGDLRVYLEGLAMVENVQEYVKQNPFGQRAITEKNLSWGFYLNVIEASSTPPRQSEQDAS
ncbi:haloacid dehalogenase-like hydrolase superfamily protein [Striga asiatica]|uniref:Mitochondrial import inner membrane translocase subunit TIM50 n=1 Tax=Striga asiatica TaxID=4170 RepID=A0A5A7QLG4_STRAF|nr:haloacid dehalogenase-like hydrolase superfamily protein [Striga asiatica]